MNNTDLEWRRSMRALRQPTAPSRDLWPAIDAALDALPARPPFLRAGRCG